MTWRYLKNEDLYTAPASDFVMSIFKALHQYKKIELAELDSYVENLLSITDNSILSIIDNNLQSRMRDSFIFLKFIEECIDHNDTLSSPLQQAASRLTILSKLYLNKNLKSSKNDVVEQHEKVSVMYSEEKQGLAWSTALDDLLVVSNFSDYAPTNVLLHIMSSQRSLDNLAQSRIIELLPIFTADEIARQALDFYFIEATQW